MWDDETACAIFAVQRDTIVFDEQTTLLIRPLIGCPR
jgi:hypothetical protein